MLPLTLAAGWAEVIGVSIALVIFIIFISLVSPEIDLTLTLAPLFALAMLSVIVASVLFLWQLRVSSQQLRRIGLSV